MFCINQQPPSDLTVSLGGLFFAFPQQIFFVAVHLVLFFFGQALALFAGDNEGTVTVFWPPHRVDLSVNLALLLHRLDQLGIVVDLTDLQPALVQTEAVLHYIPNTA